MENKEKHGIWKLLTLLAAAYGLIQAIASLMMGEGKRLEERSAGNPDKKFLNFMNGSTRKIKGESVKSIDLTTIFGGTELDLTDCELGAVTYINVSAIMSGVVIKVPPMVDVYEDVQAIMGGVANLVPNYDRKGLPVILLDVKSVMSGVSVKVIMEK